MMLRIAITYTNEDTGLARFGTILRPNEGNELLFGDPLILTIGSDKETWPCFPNEYEFETRGLDIHGALMTISEGSCDLNVADNGSAEESFNLETHAQVLLLHHNHWKTNHCERRNVNYPGHWIKGGPSGTVIKLVPLFDAIDLKSGEWDFDEGLDLIFM